MSKKVSIKVIAFIIRDLRSINDEKPYNCEIPPYKLSLFLIKVYFFQLCSELQILNKKHLN